MAAKEMAMLRRACTHVYVIRPLSTTHARAPARAALAALLDDGCWFVRRNAALGARLDAGPPEEAAAREKEALRRMEERRPLVEFMRLAQAKYSVRNSGHQP